MRARVRELTRRDVHEVALCGPGPAGSQVADRALGERASSSPGGGAVAGPGGESLRAVRQFYFLVDDDDRSEERV